jgi:hypothetical protein
MIKINIKISMMKVFILNINIILYQTKINS